MWQLLNRGLSQRAKNWSKNEINYHHNNMNKRKQFLPKIKNDFSGKWDIISQYYGENFKLRPQKKGKSNTNKYHIPSYDVGIRKYDTQG